MVEILDTKGSTKSDTTFIKRRKLLEKELLDSIAKKSEKDNTAQVSEKVNKNERNVKLLQQTQKITRHNSKTEYFLFCASKSWKTF